MTGIPQNTWMFCITMDTFFLRYSINIRNLFRHVLWKCLATYIENTNAFLKKFWYLSGCNKAPQPLILFWGIVNILQACYIEYFENVWSCLSIAKVPPCRTLWCQKSWNQIAANFDVYLLAINQLHL